MNHSCMYSEEVVLPALTSIKTIEEISIYVSFKFSHIIL